MTDLNRFLDDARNRVQAGRYDVPDSLPSNGPFPASGIIAELKPRSPSEGRLLQGAPDATLTAYVRGGAAALSILTDEDHFDGSPDLLRLAHQTGLPTLMKDFIIDERQLDCAKNLGASAVLLIERCFVEPEARESLVDAASKRGLDVLLEIFNDADWERAQHSKAAFIGVNARDLDTLQVDVAGARRLLKTVAETGRHVVALSGIQDRHGCEEARAAGADAVLVGTHLMRAPHPALWLRALQRPIAKVCGVRTQADVAAACDADLVGFVVGAPNSPRNLGALEAQKLIEDARARGLVTVLVTPHDDAWEVREWCRVAKPDFVQLHTLRPDPEWMHSLQAIPTHVLWAVAPGEPVPPGGAGVVFDGPRAGSGVVHDWAAVAKRATSCFNLVAGGITPENARAAIEATRAWGADASSSLESSPGTKDPDAIRRFVQAVQT